MIKFLSILAVGSLISGAAWAESACYTPTELEAEQTLRLHSELMVITVTCRQASNGDSLVPSYTEFTKQHIGMLHNAEQVMTHFYDNHGGHGEDRLDKLRTRLGNEFGQKIADMSSAPFCLQYRDKVLEYANASSGEVSDEVQRMQVAYRTYVQPCGSNTRIAKTDK